MKFIFKSSYENVLLDNARVINLSHLCGRTVPICQHQIRKHHAGNRRVRDSHSHPEAGVTTEWWVWNPRVSHLLCGDYLSPDSHFGKNWLVVLGLLFSFVE